MPHLVSNIKIIKNKH